MRFPSRFALKEKEGEERILKKFLWLPRQFGEDTEYRWLETAWIRERVCRVNGGSFEWGIDEWKWCEVGFANEH